MNFKEFIGHFAEAVDLDENDLSGEVEFQGLPNWDSMTMLTVIAMVDEYYGKVLSGEEIEGVKSIQDLFDLIASK